jgi:hypothetical protein
MPRQPAHAGIGSAEADLTRIKRFRLTPVIGFYVASTGIQRVSAASSVSTVRDAMFRDYLCVFLADCMSEPIVNALPQSNHNASLLSAEMTLVWVSDSERILKAVQP